jgi:hypothetical protein
VGTPFDDALVEGSPQQAAEAYASRFGAPGSATYGAAWRSFGQRVQTDDDLRLARLAARTRAALHARREAGDGS